jgi:hypothetical protein
MKALLDQSFNNNPRLHGAGLSAPQNYCRKTSCMSGGQGKARDIKIEAM